MLLGPSGSHGKRLKGSPGPPTAMARGWRLNPQWTRKVAGGALLGLQQEETAAWEPRSAGGALLGLQQEQTVAWEPRSAEGFSWVSSRNKGRTSRYRDLQQKGHYL